MISWDFLRQEIRPYVYSRPWPIHTANQRELTTFPFRNNFRTLPFHAQPTKIHTHKQSRNPWALTASPHSGLKTSKRENLWRYVLFYQMFGEKKNIPKSVAQFLKSVQRYTIAVKLEAKIAKLRKYKRLSSKLLSQ